MTDRNETESPADLAAAYAVHALNANDTAEFEAHLAESERARIEDAELNETAAALGLAVAPVQPSAALKNNVMSMLASTPQLPPVPAPRAAEADSTDVSVAGGPPAFPGAPETTPTRLTKATELPRRDPADTDPTRPVADIRSDEASGTRGTSATERAQARWFKRPAQFLLAAAAAVALFVGGTFLGQTLNNNQFESQQASSLAQINAADDSQRAAATTADGQEATLVWSNSLGISAVLVDDLPALPDDQDYQLWYINGEGAVPAGTFDSSGAGTVWRVLDGTMHAGDQVGVTVEPTGGSDPPTTNPIVAFQS